MNEKPIIFSDPMIKALLSGAKSQTRRVVKPLVPSDASIAHYFLDRPTWTWKDNFTPRTYQRSCPFGAVGDHLWVREAWGVFPAEENAPNSDWCIRYRATPEVVVHYRDNADRMGYDGVNSKWRPSIHMPRWAARIVLEIVGVRVERLQDISEQDAVAGGVEWDHGMWKDYLLETLGGKMTARESFRTLWDSINRCKHPWDSNPWVFALEFRRIQEGV